MREREAKRRRTGALEMRSYKELRAMAQTQSDADRVARQVREHAREQAADSDFCMEVAELLCSNVEDDDGIPGAPSAGDDEPRAGSKEHDDEQRAADGGIPGAPSVDDDDDEMPDAPSADDDDDEMPDAPSADDDDDEMPDAPSADGDEPRAGSQENDNEPRADSPTQPQSHTPMNSARELRDYAETVREFLETRRDDLDDPHRVSLQHALDSTVECVGTSDEQSADDCSDKLTHLKMVAVPIMKTADTARAQAMDKLLAYARSLNDDKAAGACRSNPGEAQLRDAVREALQCDVETAQSSTRVYEDQRVALEKMAHPILKDRLMSYAEDLHRSLRSGNRFADAEPADRMRLQRAADELLGDLDTLQGCSMDDYEAERESLDAIVDDIEQSVTKDRERARQSLTSYAYQQREVLARAGRMQRGGSVQPTHVRSAFDGAIEWLKTSQDRSKREYEAKLSELRRIFQEDTIDGGILTPSPSRSPTPMDDAGGLKPKEGTHVKRHSVSGLTCGHLSVRLTLSCVR
jgi:hypothetical protein